MFICRLKAVQYTQVFPFSHIIYRRGTEESWCDCSVVKDSNLIEQCCLLSWNDYISCILWLFLIKRTHKPCSCILDWLQTSTSTKATLNITYTQWNSFGRERFGNCTQNCYPYLSSTCAVCSCSSRVWIAKTRRLWLFASVRKQTDSS